MVRILEFIVSKARKDEEGQNMAEYGLVLAAVAVAAYAAYQGLGTAITNQINSVSSSL